MTYIFGLFYENHISENLFIELFSLWCNEQSDVQTGRSVHQIPCKAPMNSVEWNPKYNLLAYAGDDKNKYSADEGNMEHSS